MVTNKITFRKNVVILKTKLKHNEIQLEEKRILDEVVNFLNKNRIKYCLFGGTLLGAIRHQGFIPWDDDIDIAIPRPDYDKLQNIIKNNNKLGNNLYFHSYELKNLNMPFTKVYNYNIEIFDWRYKDKYEKYLWIDIFPIDGLPSDEKENILLFKKRDRLKKIMMYRKMSIKYMFINKEKVLKNIIKFIIKIIYSILPERLITSKIIELNKNNYEDCEYAGNLVWGYGVKERMDKKIFEEYIDVEFEGSTFKGLANYDKYLTNIYGDYMTLPPVDKRITHNFEAWRIDDEKDKE